jgi:hypothetical protein
MNKLSLPFGGIAAAKQHPDHERLALAWHLRPHEGLSELEGSVTRGVIKPRERKGSGNKDYQLLRSVSSVAELQALGQSCLPKL